MKYGSLIVASSLVIAAQADIERGLTDHFSSWLNDNQYGDFKFERTDLIGGAYGGKSSDSEKISN